MSMSQLEEIKQKLDQIILDSKSKTVNAEDDLVITSDANNITEESESYLTEQSDIIANFIQLQLDYRTDRRKQTKNKISKEHALYEENIIVCTGLRGFGYTTAISKMFNPEKDIYVGYSRDACVEMERALKKRLRESCKIYYINFKSLKYTENNVSKDIERKLDDYFKNVQIVRYDNEQQKIVVGTKEDIKKIVGKSDWGSEIGASMMRGKSIKEGAKVFIDLGTENVFNASHRIKKLICELCYINSASNNDVVFIIT